MPYNMASNFNRKLISFGPGVLYVGAALATPTVEVGAISEDGLNLNLEQEVESVYQGNPEIELFAAVLRQGVMLDFSGIEWNGTNFANVVGSGVLANSAAIVTYTWGGDPSLEALAVRIVHRMTSGGTTTLDLWRARGGGSLQVPMGRSKHTFPYTLVAQSATTDWAGNNLGNAEQLLRLRIDIP